MEKQTVYKRISCINIGVTNRRKVTMAIIFLILSATLVTVFKIAPLVRASWTVGPGLEYDSIQEAIDKADINVSDVIYVKEGTYYENINVTDHWKIRSMSGDPSSTIIVGNGSYDVVTISANNTEITGFTITNASDPYSYYSGIYVQYNTWGNTIQNNIISNNRIGISFTTNQSVLRNNTITESYLIGAYLSGYENNITENTIRNTDFDGVWLYTPRSRFYNNNVISNGRSGMKISTLSNNLIIEHNTIFNNSKGIEFESQWEAREYNIVIKDNTITSNSDHGLYVRGSNHTITENTIASNYKAGIYLYNSANNTISNNSVEKNLEYGIYLWNSSENQIINNIIRGEYSQKEGIHLNLSNKNNITNNLVLSHLENGINLNNSHENTISDNTRLGWGISYNKKFGLFLANASKNIIARNLVSVNTKGGIYMNCSNQNEVIANTIRKNTDFGVKLEFSENNTLSDNTIDGNKYNFGVWGSQLLHFIHTIHPNNKIDEKNIYYLVNPPPGLIVNNDTFPNAGYIALINSTAVTVKGHFTLTKNLQGILLAWTTNSVINACRFHGNYHGISMLWSNNNTVIDSGILENQYGILMRFSYGNNITHNNFKDNTEAAMYVINSSNNIIYYNNFATTEFIKFLYDFANSWNYSTHGNYWHPITGELPLPPYSITVNNIDFHPLNHPLMSSLPADFDWDGDSDIYDVVRLARRYGCKYGDLGWDPYVDILWDEGPSNWKIDIFDIVRATRFYGETRDC